MLLLPICLFVCSFVFGGGWGWASFFIFQFRAFSKDIWEILDPISLLPSLPPAEPDIHVLQRQSASCWYYTICGWLCSEVLAVAKRSFWHWWFGIKHQLFRQRETLQHAWLRQKARCFVNVFINRLEWTSNSIHMQYFFLQALISVHSHFKSTYNEDWRG